MSEFSLLDWFVAHETFDNAAVEQCRVQATRLVEDYIGQENPWRVPEAIKERAVVELTADLFYRRAARNGVAGIDSAELTPFRINRDPMVSIRPLLATYIPPAFA